MLCYGSTLIEHLAHNPKIKGWNPATGTRIVVKAATKLLVYLVYQIGLIAEAIMEAL